MTEYRQNNARSACAMALLALLGVACGPSDRELAYYERNLEPAPEPRPVPTASIDTDGRIEAEGLGEQRAAIVEYEQGGSWFLGVTCDTASSGEVCEWDIIVETLAGSEPIFRVLEKDLERSDLVLVDFTAARLVSLTSDDLDGVSFRVREGTGLRVDVFLDGAPHPELVRWIGDGAMHLGAPDNPFDLSPSTP